MDDFVWYMGDVKMTDKLKWIEKNKHQNNKILIRTDLSKGWFIHFIYVFKDGENFYKATVYKNYSDNLDAELDKIIDIIKNHQETEYHQDTVGKYIMG